MRFIGTLTALGSDPGSKDIKQELGMFECFSEKSRCPVTRLSLP